jgi:hypothetical protein
MWMRDAECVATDVEGELVLLDLEGGMYFTLNGPAADVWNALEATRSEGDLVDILVGKYNVDPAKCAESVTRLLGNLSEKGLAKPAA